MLAVYRGLCLKSMGYRIIREKIFFLFTFALFCVNLNLYTVCAGQRGSFAHISAVLADADERMNTHERYGNKRQAAF